MRRRSRCCAGELAEHSRRGAAGAPERRRAGSARPPRRRRSRASRRGRATSARRRSHRRRSKPRRRRIACCSSTGVSIPITASVRSGRKRTTGGSGSSSWTSAWPTHSRPGELDDQLRRKRCCLLRKVGIDALLPAVRALGAQPQPLGRPEDRVRLEVRGLEQDLGRVFADLGLFAAHDPGERDRARLRRRSTGRMARAHGRYRRACGASRRPRRGGRRSCPRRAWRSRTRAAGCRARASRSSSRRRRSRSGACPRRAAAP